MTKASSQSLQSVKWQFPHHQLQPGAFETASLPFMEYSSRHEPCLLQSIGSTYWTLPLCAEQPYPILPGPPPPFWMFLVSEALLVSSLSFQGIQFLIENDLLKNTCEDIAQFLYKGEGLNKTAIGDYLGER